MDGTMVNNILVVLQIFVIIATVGVSVWKTSAKITALVTQTERKIDLLSAHLDFLGKTRDEQHQMNINRFVSIEGQMKELTSATVKLVAVEERMSSIDVRVQELSNRINDSGKSITKPKRRS